MKFQADSEHLTRAHLLIVAAAAAAAAFLISPEFFPVAARFALPLPPPESTERAASMFAQHEQALRVAGPARLQS